jgi:hypothetical protein
MDRGALWHVLRGLRSRLRDACDHHIWAEPGQLAWSFD